MAIDEDRMKAMSFREPGRIPVSVSLLPAAWMKYRSELDAIVRRHPALFGQLLGGRD